jgi:hypothetical protein
MSAVVWSGLVRLLSSTVFILPVMSAELGYSLKARTCYTKQPTSSIGVEAILRLHSSASGTLRFCIELGSLTRILNENSE